MKKIALLTGILCNVAMYAQDTTALSVDDFDIPTSPGFVLLDKTPSVIERPNSGRAFAVSVLNSFTENRGVPQNYAVEFTPFWFLPHPKMSALKYVGYVPKNGGYKQNCFHQATRGSISAAFITTDDSITHEPVTNLSYGYRTTLFTIRSKKQMQALKLANDSTVYGLKAQQGRMVAAGITPRLKLDNPTEYNKRLTAFLATDKANAQALLAKAMEQKPLVALDVAFAHNVFFLDNNYYNHHFGRFGAWATLNVALPLGKAKDGSPNYLNIFGFGRYLADGTQHGIDTTTFIRHEYSDFGVKIEMEFDKLSFGYEYISRNGTGEYHTFRSNGLIKYQISDHMYLTGAFGKNFGAEHNLISMLGINWGISSGNEKVTTPAQ